MDLREKFIEDLFYVMHDKDKGNPSFEDLADDEKISARILAEGMLKRGWYVDAEKGKL